MDHLDQAAKIVTVVVGVVTLASGGLAIWFRERISQLLRRRRTLGPAFRGLYNHNTNARPYIGLVVGAIPERPRPFDSRDIDVIRAWLGRVRPDAQPLKSSGAQI